MSYTSLTAQSYASLRPTYPSKLASPFSRGLLCLLSVLAADLDTSYLILRDVRAWIDGRRKLIQWYGLGDYGSSYDGTCAANISYIGARRRGF